MMIAALTDRSIISVTGPDAEDFLQNIMTNDIAKATDSTIVYSCLLTPQGQILNEFFVVKRHDPESYWIDIEASQRDNLIRRLGFFKLRAKVKIEAIDTVKVTAVADKTEGAFEDPRLTGLGYRVYSDAYLKDATDASAYDDFLITQGIPNGSKTIKLEKDVSADMNLDLLNAIAWDKGCFIGQEVAARMYHRNLNKKRLMIVQSAAGFEAGQVLKKNGMEVGEIRQKTAKSDQALAQIKIAALNADTVPEYSLETDNGIIQLTTVSYLKS